MDDKEKLLLIWREVDDIKSFIRSEHVDGKINTETAKEIYRMLTQIGERVTND